MSIKSSLALKRMANKHKLILTALNACKWLLIYFVILGFWGAWNHEKVVKQRETGRHTP